MRKRMVKQILAYVLSASLIAGGAMPVFAAEAGVEAEEQLIEESVEEIPDEVPTEAPDEVAEEYVSGSEEEYIEETSEEVIEEIPDAAEDETESFEIEESAEEVLEEEVVSSEAEEELLENEELSDSEELQESEEIIEDEPEITLAAASGNAKLADEDPEVPPTSGQCGPTLNWEIVAGTGTTTLKISGTGAMDAYTTDSPAPWIDSMTQLTDLEIASGATAIGTNAFAGATALKNAMIPASVTTIPEDAFTGVTGLTVKGAFKSAARSLRQAVSIDAACADEIPSTKGVL